MKEVRYREFWRKFKKYKEGFESVRVVGQGGEVFGVYYPSGTEPKEEGGTRQKEKTYASVVSHVESVKPSIADLRKLVDEKHFLSTGQAGAQKVNAVQQGKVENVKFEVEAEPCVKCSLPGEFRGFIEMPDGFQEVVVCAACKRKFKLLGFNKRI